MKAHGHTLGLAAIEVLANQGSRAFTHRAVDRQAGLPEGTASRYARTRAALLELASDALLAEDRRAIARALTGNGVVTTAPPQGADELAALLVRATKALLAAPERYRARVELQLESARTPVLHTHYRYARDIFVEPLAEMVAALGHADSHQTADLLVTTLDGILHRQLVLGQPSLTDSRLHTVFASVLLTLNHAE